MFVVPLWRKILLGSPLSYHLNLAVFMLDVFNYTTREGPDVGALILASCLRYLRPPEAFIKPLNVSTTLFHADRKKRYALCLRVGRRGDHKGSHLFGTGQISYPEDHKRETSAGQA